LVNGDGSVELNNRGSSGDGDRWSMGMTRREGSRSSLRWSGARGRQHDGGSGMVLGAAGNGFGGECEFTMCTVAPRPSSAMAPIGCACVLLGQRRWRSMIRMGRRLGRAVAGVAEERGVVGTVAPVKNRRDAVLSR
jgi:hypothetical protein